MKFKWTVYDQLMGVIETWEDTLNTTGQLRTSTTRKLLKYSELRWKDVVEVRAIQL